MMNIRLIPIVLLEVSLLIAGGTAFARSEAEATDEAVSASAAEVVALRDRLQQLERQQQQTLAELDQLRARLESETPPPPSPDLAPYGDPEPDVDLDILVDDTALPRRVDFHGHLAFSYLGFEEPSLAPTGGPGSSLSDLNPQSSFNLTDLSFFVGIPLAPRLYAATEIEYELGGDEIDLEQAFIQWDLWEEEKLAMRLGKFYVPFGIERYYQNAPQNPLVDRPSPFIHVIPGTYSESGITLEGARVLNESPELIGEFEVALMNGLGAQLFDSAREARQNSDNNSNKLVSGRLGLSYDRWLELGVSGLGSKYDDENEDGYYGLGGDVRATWGGFFLRGEYVYMKIQNPDLVDANGTPCSKVPPVCPGLVPPLTPLGGTFNRYGWYAEATYSHQPDFLTAVRELEYVIRYDDLNEDDSISDLLDARRVSLGLVVHPMDHFRLKFQYELTDEDSDEIENNAFLFQAAVDW